MARFFGVVLLTTLLLSSALAELFTVEDLHAIPRVGDADFFPSATTLGVYTRRQWDSETNEVRVNLRLAKGKDVKDLTGPFGVRDSNPRFTPDGKVLFSLWNTGLSSSFTGCFQILFRFGVLDNSVTHSSDCPLSALE